jgi:hypothetical protein
MLLRIAGRAQSAAVAGDGFIVLLVLKQSPPGIQQSIGFSPPVASAWCLFSFRLVWGNSV